MSKVRHFINILDHDREFLSALIDKAIADKKLLRQGRLLASMAGKTLAVYFEKPSLRTRVSFEVAAFQLTGHSLYLTESEIGLGKREPVRDVARVISGMCDGIVIRAFSHDIVTTLCRYASVPVINALTDYSHPCQAMADMMTAKEKLGRLEGLKLAYIGDGNNVARSLAAACARLRVEFVIAGPTGYLLDDAFVGKLMEAQGDAKFEQCTDPYHAVKNADIVYTDTWVSMGQEQDHEERMRAFDGYQVNDKLLGTAAGSAIVMHCLPAYRGCEITDNVMECEQSVVFDEAENRLHFQRALLAVLVGQEAI